MSFSDADDEMEMEFLRDQYEDNRYFEVFLSFRGEDTRASFTSHLYAALQNAGIIVYKDDESLPRGKQISPSLRLAIEESRISIVVFSKNYAESRWCMKELEKIMECHRTIGHVVLPVFYDVDPSEVRHQRGHFGKAFQQLLDKISEEEMEEEKVLDWMQHWRKTVAEVNDISEEDVRWFNLEELDEIKHWKSALVEAARIPGFVDLNSSGRMKIDDGIDNLVKHWTVGLREGLKIRIGRGMDIEYRVDFLLTLWREIRYQASRISVASVVDPRGEMEIANGIELEVNHWRETLFEAAGISRGAILNTWQCWEMEITNAIELQVKHSREAFCEDADISWGEILDPDDLNFNSDDIVDIGMRKFNNELRILMNHRRDELRNAAYKSRDDLELYSSRETKRESRLEHWRKSLAEAVISTGADYGPSIKMLKNYNRIENLVQSWRMALWEAARTSRLVLQHYRGIKDNEFNILVKRGRDALHEAAGISGVVVLNTRNESVAIKNIVQNVTSLLDKTELFVANNPVGVEPRVQEMVHLLDQKQSNDVLLLGVWGMGGIGKTTIAKAIYNKIGRNFEGRSFLADIREVWGQEGGQVCLQEQLLFDINKENVTKIHNIESGKIILKERLRHKRVLLILDDVNKLQQLNVLCGSREWVGPGSRIIITTRDIHILRGKSVDKVFKMTGMDVDESIELFSWHAFKQARPKEDFTELSRNVVAYSGGLPLALEVLGFICLIWRYQSGRVYWKNS